MSRIGRQPIKIPEGVTVEIKDRQVEVVGPKGSLVQAIRPEIKVEIKNNQVVVSRKTESRLGRSLHGLTRTLIANMIEGVTKGFVKTLKLVGTGYRVKADPSADGKKLILSLGFSHPVEVESVEGIKFEVEGNDTIRVVGIDKALVGREAAKIRAIRPPEPYKGKGIRYLGEQVRRKPGKAGKAGAAGFGG